MYWLITFDKELDAKQLDELLLKWEAERTDMPSIPLDDDEIVIEVSGPKDLPRKIASEKGVLKVSPSSSYTFY
jgi:hypothetical protein